MIILQTDCTPEQIKEDTEELKKAHSIALETMPTWQFFGGMITLTNGNKYQVTS
jgi:hypothetical protein